MDLRLVLVLCALTAFQAASSSKIVSGECAKKCQPNDNEINEYPKGKTYSHRFSARTLVNSWNTEIDIKGDVHITRLSTCDYALELQNFAIKGVSNAKSLEDSLKARSLRFAWIDGQISDVCAHPDEEDWALNVKKAILSTLQLEGGLGIDGYAKKHERDILGDCETVYKVKQIFSGGTILTKTKNLATCRNHHDEPIAAAVKAIYSIGQPEFSCETTWDRKNILQKAACGHVAASRSMVMSNVTLELSKGASGPKPTPLEKFVRTTLLVNPVAPVKRSTSEVSNLMADLCKSIENEIKPVAPEKFRDLVDSLETLTYPELKQVWESMVSTDFKGQCKSERVKVILVDALLQTRTGPVLKFLVKDLAAKQLVSEMKLKAVFHSLVYKVSPCEDALEAIIELLQSNRQLRQSLFGVTAAIQRYIDLGYDRKLADQALDLVIKRFNQASNEQDKVVIGRALSNIRFDADKIEKTLTGYIERSVHPELRVAAIETLGQVVQCRSSSLLSKLRKMIYTTSEPNEVRVRALKALLRCADDQAVNELKSYIERSTNSADGHFVSFADSYLRNALQTMNIDKQIVKEIASQGQATWKSPQATMSRHLELSRTTPSGQFGFNYEIDSIVEQGQQVPTWVVVNASLPIRQHNELTFEMGVRQEGLVELGSKLMDKLNQINMEEYQRLAQESVDRRDYQPLVNKLSQLLEEIKQLVQANGKMSAYIKVNGVCLFYWNGQVSSLNNMETYKRLVIEDTPLNKMLETGLGWIFVDYKVSSPMASGLLLRYHHQGSLVPGLKAHLKTEKTDATSTGRFGFFPNFALEHIYGRELVLHKPIAGDYRKNVLTSTVLVEGAAKIISSGKDGKVYSLIIDSSRPEIELFRVHSVKMIRDLTGDKIIEKSYSYNREMCSTEYTDRLFGFAFCVSAKAEDHTKLNADKNFDLRFFAKKTDKSVKHYELSLKREPTTWGLTIDAPGSNVNRRVEINLGAKGDLATEKSARYWFDMVSPVKTIASNLSLSYPEGQPAFLTMETTIDRRSHSLKLTLNRTQPKQKILNLMVNSPLLREAVDYDFTVNHELPQAFALQVHSNVNNRRIRLANLKMKLSGQESGKIEFELNNKQSEKMLGFFVEGSKKGTYPYLPGSMQVHSKIDYRRKQGKMENIEFDFNTKIDKTEKVYSGRADWEVKTTQWPQIQGKLMTKAIYRPQPNTARSYLEYTVEAKWGPESRQQSASWSQEIDVDRSSVKNFNLKVKSVAKSSGKFEKLVELEVTKSENAKPSRRLLIKSAIKDVPTQRKGHAVIVDLQYPSEDNVYRAHFTHSLDKVAKSLKTAYNPDMKSKVHYIAQYKNYVEDGEIINGHQAEVILSRNDRRRFSKVYAGVSRVADDSTVAKFEGEWDLATARDTLNGKLFLGKTQIAAVDYLRDGKHQATLIVPRTGSVKVTVDPREKRLAIETKDSADWKHQIETSLGKIKSFKAITPSGVKMHPDIDIEADSVSKSAKLSFIAPTYSMLASVRNYDSEPDFKAEFKCTKHSITHKTEFKWLRSSKQLTSVYKQKNSLIYDFDLKHSTTGQHKTQVNFQMPGLVDSRTAFVYDKSYKLDSNTKINKYYLVLKHQISTPVPINRFRFADTKSYPVVDFDVQFGRETDFEARASVTNKKPIKIHMQYKTQGTVPFVFDSSFKPDVYQTVGHIGREEELKWNIALKNIKPSNKILEMTVNLGKNEIASELELVDQPTHWSVQGKKMVIKKNGQKIWDGKTDLKLAKNLPGPHSLRITETINGDELFISYKRDDKLEALFKLVNDRKKVIETSLTGERSRAARGVHFNGKLDVNSETVPALKQVTYTIDMTKDYGLNYELTAEKKGDQPLKLYLDAKLSSKTPTFKINLNGKSREGKDRRLEIDYKRTNKITFNAKLYEMNDVDSSAKVVIPLVHVAEFIGNEIIVNLKSVSLDSEVKLELSAPNKQSIHGLVDLKVKGEKLFEYEMKTNEGKEIALEGRDKVDIVNPIGLDHKITFKGRQILRHQILVSDKLVGFRFELQNLFKVNQAILKTDENKPEIIGKYCWRESCTKMASKLVLGEKKGSIEMNLQGPKESMKAVINGKWNCDQGKTEGSMIVLAGPKGRRYGAEWSRDVISDKKVIYNGKLHLPERTMSTKATKNVQTASADKLIASYIIEMKPKEEADPFKVTLDRSIKRSDKQFKGTHVMTLEHPKLGKPIKVQTEVEYQYSSQPGASIFGFKKQLIKVDLYLEDSSEPDLKGLAQWNMESGQLTYSWRAWSKDNKIDFGCESENKQQGSLKLFNLVRVNSYTCHWVNRHGEKKIYSRNQKLTMVNLNGFPQITFSDNLKHPLSSFFYNGTFNLAEALKDATIDLDTKDGRVYRVKALMDTANREKCFTMNLTQIAEIADPDSRTNYAVRSCINMKPKIGEPVVSFKIINLAESTPSEVVIFTIKRMVDYVNDYLITLKWSPEDFSVIAMNAVDTIESVIKKRIEFINERDAEIKHKKELMAKHLKHRMDKITSLWSNDLNELTHELKPEIKLSQVVFNQISKRLRKRRSVPSWGREDGSSASPVDFTAPMSYQWRVYDPESGHLELVLRNVEAAKVPRFMWDVYSIIVNKKLI